MKAAHENALLELLKTVNGASFISIDTLTVPAMNKTLSGRGASAVPNPHFGRVTKRRDGVVVMVFQNKLTNGYDNMVHRRLLAEGKDPESFVLGERAWGTRMKDLPVVEHNGKYYLEVIFLKEGQEQWLLDGQPVNESELQGVRATAPEQGGLDNKVILRCFAFDSIEQIKIDGTTFILN